jgi:hypothetical protein
LVTYIIDDLERVNGEFILLFRRLSGHRGKEAAVFIDPRDAVNAGGRRKTNDKKDTPAQESPNAVIRVVAALSKPYEECTAEEEHSDHDDSGKSKAITEG